MKKQMVAFVIAAFVIAALPVYVFAGQEFLASSCKREGNSVSKVAEIQSETAAQTKTANEIFYVKGITDYSKAADVLTRVNKERRKAGVPVLTMDTELQQAAMQRAAELSLSFEHNRPDGTSCFSVCDKAYGENIASGTRLGPAEAMYMWMLSPGHRANILYSGYKSIGIGCFYQRNGCMYWVQLFGAGNAEGKTVEKGTKTRTFSIRAVPGSIKIFPALSGGLAIGKGRQQSAFTIRAQNANVSMESTAVEPRTFCWKSSNSRVSVNTSGTMIGKKLGSAVVRASLPVSGQSVSKKITVKAVPKKVALRSVKAGKRIVKVTWKRNKKASGYQVFIARNKSFTKGKKRVTISRNRTTTTTVKKLKRKKVYYVKVRAFKKVGNSKLYGNYSKIKRVKVK